MQHGVVPRPSRRRAGVGISLHGAGRRNAGRRRAGRPAGLRPLYARYVGPIHRYCSARLRDREAAEDATSEVFVKALAALPRYREQVFVAWLFRIARNVVIDVHRRRRPTAPLTAAALAAAGPPDELVEAAAEREAIWAAVAALPDDQRAAVELRLVGWSDERIAIALGRSRAAVRMLRLRALATLRTRLPRR